MIIAVDGPAAAGKGTLTRRLAAHFGYAHLDTGRLYRAVALMLSRRHGNPDDAMAAAETARAIGDIDLEDTALRDEAIGALASKLSGYSEVRAELLDYQRRFAARPPGGEAGAVLDGRDIGTVVCPGADAKIFLTASVEVRAARRVKELREGGDAAIYARVLRDMERRDEQDRTRQISPLVPASDAFILDTDALDADAVFAAALDFIKSRNANPEDA